MTSKLIFKLDVILKLGLLTTFALSWLIYLLIFSGEVICEGFPQSESVIIPKISKKESNSKVYNISNSSNASTPEVEKNELTLSKDEHLTTNKIKSEVGENNMVDCEFETYSKENTEDKIIVLSNMKWEIKKRCMMERIGKNSFDYIQSLNMSHGIPIALIKDDGEKVCWLENTAKPDRYTFNSGNSLRFISHNSAGKTKQFHSTSSNSNLIIGGSRNLNMRLGSTSEECWAALNKSIGRWKLGNT